ncbi:hypothetical protein V6N12_029143 [Hibiscus sabdariffa]|uniref:Uncharacterized protein n=1 Tax=Hibiscus sabdariffa TaxID=183260 RepID=A0ABR2A664_9ROSI
MSMSNDGTIGYTKGIPENKTNCFKKTQSDQGRHEDCQMVSYQVGKSKLFETEMVVEKPTIQLKKGDLVQIDAETLASYTFKRCRVQIETTWVTQIDELLDLLIGEHVFQIRVLEFEETIGPKCDGCCEIDGDSSSDKRYGIHKS